MTGAQFNYTKNKSKQEKTDNKITLLNTVQISNFHIDISKKIVNSLYFAVTWIYLLTFQYYNNINIC